MNSLRGVKTAFLTKPVTILWKPVIYRHVSHGCSPPKEGSWRNETQLRTVITISTACVKWPVVYSVFKCFGCCLGQLHLPKFLSSLDGSRMWEGSKQG